MASESDIKNLALLKIGADSIVVGDNSRNDTVSALMYPEVRDNMLRSHPWNFASTRVKLAQSANSPQYEWEYQYPIPADFMRAMEVHDNSDGSGLVEYKIEHDNTDGSVIRTDAAEVWLTYVSKVTDPNKMPPDFRTAFSLALAAELAIPIAESSSLSERLEAKAIKALRKARSTDSMEDFPDQFPQGSWMTSRFTDYDTGR